jgi:Family of unknown function (DUF6941)
VRLDFVLLADRARQSEGGKIDIEGGGVTHVEAPELPFRLPSLAIVFRFFLEPGDETREQTLAVHRRDPDGEAIVVLKGELKLEGEGLLGGVHVGEDAILFVVAELEGLSFASEGRHVFEFRLDDVVLAELGVAVVLTQDSSPAAESSTESEAPPSS